MYNKRKIHRFVQYYSESDREYYESTVKDTFWEELCQGKLELPSGDLYSSIKTVKRKCNSFSLNEADFWWNQVFDSPSDESQYTFDETSRKSSKKKKRKIFCIDREKRENLEIKRRIKQEADLQEKVIRKKVKQRNLEVKDAQMAHNYFESGDQILLSSQEGSEDNIVKNAPEKIKEVITPVNENSDEMLQKGSPNNLGTISPSLSHESDRSLRSSNSFRKQSEKSHSIESAQRNDSVSSAPVSSGVERFLTTVKEIFSNCSFQNRKSSRIYRSDAPNTQKSLSRDRQLFNNLASIISFDGEGTKNTEPTRVHLTDKVPFSAASSNSSSEWEHAKNSGFIYPTTCKIENDKHPFRESSDGIFKSAPNVKDSIKISLGEDVPLVIPACYVKLEKLDFQKVLAESERLKCNWTSDKKDYSAVLSTHSSIDECLIDSGCPIENYGSKEGGSKIILSCCGEDTCKMSAYATQSLELNTDLQESKNTFSENILGNNLRHSASDSFLINHSQGQTNVNRDLIGENNQSTRRTSTFNRKRALKRRIIGHVIDTPSYNILAFNKKRAKGMRQKALIGRKKVSQTLTSRQKYCSSLEHTGLLSTSDTMKSPGIEVEKVSEIRECGNENHLGDEVPFVNTENPDLSQSDFQPPEASGADNGNENDLMQTSAHCEPYLSLENISFSCANDFTGKADTDICNLDIISHIEVVEVNFPTEESGEGKLPDGMLGENTEENSREIKSCKSSDDCREIGVVPIKNEVRSIPLNTENHSFASDLSSIDAAGQGEILICDETNDADINTVRHHWHEYKKKRSSVSDPRLSLKRIQNKKARLIRTRKSCRLSDGQLLEQCRQKLHKLIAEGILEEVCANARSNEKPADAQEKRNADVDPKENPEVHRRTMEATDILSPEIEEIGMSNINSNPTQTVLVDCEFSQESFARKGSQSECDANSKVSETSNVRPSSRTSVTSCKPQDPRRRSIKHAAVARETNSVKHDQRDRCSWVESLEERSVPNISSVSLWPLQLEVIPASPAVNSLDNAAINQAVTKGDLRIMEKIITSLPSHLKWDLEQPDEKGDTLLMVAARNDDSQMIMLLRNRVNLNHKNYQKRTPLMIAAHYGKLRSVATLLESGAHIDSRDFTGKTALLLAVESNQDYVVHLLLSKGANFCPLTLTSSNFKDTEEQERASRINICLNSHISGVTKHFDSTIFKWAGAMGFNKFRALTAVQFMTPCQVQKFEFTFSIQPDVKLSDNLERRIVLFGTHCAVQYNWFDGEVPISPDLVGGVKCNGVRMASMKDTAFLLTNVGRGFNVISIGIRPDLHPEPKAGAFVRDKLAFRVYELSMPPLLKNEFVRKERI